MGRGGGGEPGYRRPPQGTTGVARVIGAAAVDVLTPELRALLGRPEVPTAMGEGLANWVDGLVSGRPGAGGAPGVTPGTDPTTAREAAAGLRRNAMA